VEAVRFKFEESSETPPARKQAKKRGRKGASSESPDASCPHPDSNSFARPSLATFPSWQLGPLHNQESSFFNLFSGNLSRLRISSAKKLLSKAVWKAMSAINEFCRETSEFRHLPAFYGVFSLSAFQFYPIPLFPRNPHFPALRSSPTAVSGATCQKQIPSSQSSGIATACGHGLSDIGRRGNR